MPPPPNTHAQAQLLTLVGAVEFSKPYRMSRRAERWIVVAVAALLLAALATFARPVDTHAIANEQVPSILND
jgi:hypothetical protein